MFLLSLRIEHFGLIPQFNASYILLDVLGLSIILKNNSKPPFTQKLYNSMLCFMHSSYCAPLNCKEK